MSTTFDEMQKRMNHLGNLNNFIEDLFEKIPGNLISKKQQKKLMDVVMNDDELKLLLEGLKNPRPPRFVLVGRTGVGKSSFINAMSGHYLAEVSDVEIGTKEARRFTYESDGQVYFEVIDTRGIGESETFKVKAEEDLLEVIRDFNPDALLFLQKATERAHIDKDIEITKRIIKKANVELPLVGIITHIDELHPSREKKPANYPTEKKELIREKKAQLMRIFNEYDLKYSAIIPVSSYIEWSGTSDNPEMKQTMDFDGRYGIEELLDFLESSIDVRAAIHLGMTIRLNKVAEKIANRFIKVFSAVAATVALSPIIATDIAVLLALQTILLMIVAYLSGRDLEFKTARELLISIGGIGATGFTLRMIAQQGSKFVNLVLPGAGSAISASIASGGTYAIGKAAVAYYLKDVPESKLKNIVKEAREEFDGLSE
ncbi:GTPase family protein [Sporosarcina siberiensis]|uniref:GTPase family protein n=1 Tax=Sporosarcina siberiensis TaxID=1365606 RepID=A0ABW4SD01_9BACL